MSNLWVVERTPVGPEAHSGVFSHQVSVCPVEAPGGEMLWGFVWVCVGLWGLCRFVGFCAGFCGACGGLCGFCVVCAGFVYGFVRVSVGCMRVCGCVCVVCGDFCGFVRVCVPAESCGVEGVSEGTAVPSLPSPGLLFQGRLPWELHCDWRT